MTSTMINNVFAQLIAQYTTSETLFAYLTSAEGGSLTVRDTRSDPTDSLVVVHYKKGVSDLTKPHVPYFRSVVWNTRSNRPVCAGPPHGHKFTTEGLTGLTTFVAEDFVDGVMLNMFWDGAKNSWRIASRSQMDAMNTFYSKKPFAMLFFEAIAAQNLNLDELNRDYTYSWVLQHPEERVVTSTPYGMPRLRLVEMARFQEDGSQCVVREPATFLTARFRETLPERHELASLEDVKERVVAWGRRFGAQWQGLVLKNTGAGELPARWKLRTDQYDAARELRGSVAKLPFIWLERWSNNQITQYLRLYPEEAHAANAVIDGFKACTQEAYDLYQKVYRERAFPLKEAPQKYRKLLWDIHGARAGSYFPNLREFMNKQDTARKLWLVNYEARYGPALTLADGDFPPLTRTVTNDNAELDRACYEAEGLAAVAKQEAAVLAEQDAVLDALSRDEQDALSRDASC